MRDISFALFLMGKLDLFSAFEWLTPGELGIRFFKVTILPLKLWMSITEGARSHSDAIFLPFFANTYEPILSLCNKVKSCEGFKD